MRTQYIHKNGPSHYFLFWKVAPLFGYLVYLFPYRQPVCHVLSNVRDGWIDKLSEYRVTCLYLMMMMMLSLARSLSLALALFISFSLSLSFSLARSSSLSLSLSLSRTQHILNTQTNTSFGSTEPFYKHTIFVHTLALS